MNNLGLHLNQFQTLYAACIGALGLILTVCITIWMTFKFHKSEKLAEIRLKAYIDLTGKYTDYLMYLAFNRDNISDVIKENLSEKLHDILINYNQACLVSNSKIKDELDIFLNEYLVPIHHQVQENTVNIKKLHELEDYGISISFVLRKEIGVVTDSTIEEKIIKRAYNRMEAHL